MTFATRLADIAGRLAVNPALRYTALNQLVRLMLGPAVLVALPVFLTAEELGFWYAMTGVAAIMAFADMGLSTAVLQFSAHEYAEVEAARAAAGGDAFTDSRRQDALFLFAMRRIGRVCLIGLPLVFVGGLWSMGNHHGGGAGGSVGWIIPWTLFCLASALALMVSVMLAFREGQDGVWLVQRLRAAMSFVTLAATITGAASGLGIWTLPLASLATSAVGFAVLARGHLPGPLRLRAVPQEAVRDWSASMSTILSRYSLSWIGGYVMFQLFAPITMYLKGPVLAGRVGLTVSVFTAIFSLANVWLAFRLPLMSMAVAVRNAPMLRRVFLSGLAAALLSYLFLAGVALAAYFTFGDIPTVARRLLAPTSVVLLAVGWGLQVVVHNSSLFIRAFKVDPLVVVTWVAAIHTVIGTAAFLYFGRPDLMFVAFVSSYVWTLPVVYLLCRRRMRDIAAWPDPS
ncbi:hypothetical protein [Sphingomonas sp. GV3]|uniref:hypothetical protein n=1 Tax=Sphingomonas sp. GV3 TaxID=3040671 RepID=UPI00280AFC8C|nr:hypothetical protein [Sphingomonas sp. GV3]